MEARAELINGNFDLPDDTVREILGKAAMCIKEVLENEEDVPTSVIRTMNLPQQAKNEACYVKILPFKELKR